MRRSSRSSSTRSPARKRVDPTLLRAAATMGLAALARSSGRSSCPAALPAIGVGLRIAMGVAWTAIVAAELAVGAKAGGGGSGGIGQMMFVFYAYSIELNRIIVCMIAVGLVALVLDRLLRVGMRLLMPWTRTMSDCAPKLRLAHVRQALRSRRQRARDGRRRRFHARHRAGRVPRHRRTVGLRQDDGAQHARRSRACRASGTRDASTAARSRTRVPSAA